MSFKIAFLGHGDGKAVQPEVTSSKPASVVADVDRNSPQESSDRSPPGGDRDQAKDEKSGQETSSFSARADQEAMVKKTGTIEPISYWLVTS